MKNLQTRSNTLNFINNSKHLSSTIQQLPHISKKYLLSNKLRKHPPKNKSSYINSVKQIAKDVEYDHLNTTNIYQQQKNLKQLLKNINDHTIHLIDSISPAKIKTTKQANPAKTLNLRHKQYQNNQQIISVCQTEMETLKKRTQEIIGGKQFIHNKIKPTLEEIQKISAQNRYLKWENYKRGKNIIEAINAYPQLLTMQQENQLLLTKVNKLKQQDGQVKQDLYLLINSTEQLNDKYKEALVYFNKKRVISKQMDSNEITNKQYLIKQYQIEAINSKKNNLNSKLQYKYLKQLKNIQNITQNIQLTNNKIVETDSNIKLTEQQLNVLELQLKRVKKQKKQKFIRVNQFLKKNQFRLSQNSQSDKDFQLVHAKEDSNEKNNNEIIQNFNQKIQQSLKQSEVQNN